MKAKLLSMNTDIGESEIVLDPLPVTLGRSDEAHIRINDRWVSRVNCEIDLVDDALVVRDLESSNGTLVNGEHVTEQYLRPGDKLTVGMSTFIVSFNGRKRKLSPTESTLQQQKALVDEHAGATLIGKHPK